MTPQRVLVVGTGLLGTSVALALRSAGAEVWLTDRDLRAVRLAVDRGAGTQGPPPQPVDLCVLAVPPGAVAEVLYAAQGAGYAAAYTDVASVKAVPLREAAERGCDLSAFVGGHPMAGAERSGPEAARADLFTGRPWVLTPTPATSPAALGAARALALACGAEPVALSADEHDRAVAVVSHVPHLLAALAAARLADAPAALVALAGQGVRDVTRVAASDPDLWAGILAANAGLVADVLDAVAADLAGVAAALRPPLDPDAVRDLLVRGRTGRARIPESSGDR
ncbi:prephenate dehydrogenase [soil metagenome]